VVLLIFLLVVAGASSELAAQKRANACSIAALVLTIAGISLFSSGKVAFGVAETIISTAHICLVALAAYVMCCIVQKTKNKRAHTALFSLAFLVSGMFSIYYIGVMVKRILGYDLEILGPLAIVALSAMVVIYVIVNGVGHSFMQRNLEKENANLLKHQHELIAANAELSVRAEMQGATEETSASAEAADWKISAADVLQGLGLTRRETDVMLLMCEAWSDTMIANELGISRSTVRFHINNAYKKTACHSRVEFLALLRGQTSVSLPAAIIGEMSASC
jgi:DNA-binding CsgD family transcriptional regulator